MLWLQIVCLDIESHHLSVTNKSLLDDTVFDNVNVVVEPFAVNSSTVLSAISKLITTSPINDANILSDDSKALY